MKRLLLLAALAVMASVSCKKEISTKSDTLYVVTDDSEVTATNVTLTGRVRSDYLEEAKTAGFVVSGTSGKYSGAKEFSCALKGNAEYSVSVSIATDLDDLHGKRWYYKAFVDLDSGRKYGKERSFLIDPIHVSSVTLNPSTTQYNLKVGETANIEVVVKPDNASDKSFKVTSSDTKVASVKSSTVNGNPGITITALAAGTATVSVKSNYGQITANCGVAVRSATAPSGAIDLGLGVYWGTRNLGATSDLDGGTKYNLKTGEDPATKVKGGSWRLPTTKEVEQLYKQCTMTSVTDGTPWSSNSSEITKQVRGVKFTSKINGNSIILPAVFGSWKYASYNPEQWEITYLSNYWTGSWTSDGRVMVYELKLVQKYYASDGELITQNFYNDQTNYMASNYEFYVRPVAD